MFHEVFAGLIVCLYLTITIISTSYALIVGHFREEYDITATEITEHFSKIMQPLRGLVALFAIYPITPSIGTRIFHSYSVNIALLSFFILVDFLLFQGTLSVALQNNNELFVTLVISVLCLIGLVCIYIYNNIRTLRVMYKK